MAAQHRSRAFRPPPARHGTPASASYAVRAATPAMHRPDASAASPAAPAPTAWACSPAACRSRAAQTSGLPGTRACRGCGRERQGRQGAGRVSRCLLHSNDPPPPPAATWHPPHSCPWQASSAPVLAGRHVAVVADDEPHVLCSRQRGRRAQHACKGASGRACVHDADRPSLPRCAAGVSARSLTV